MSHVTQYNRIGKSTLYDAKVCLRNDCNIINNQYKIENAAPKEQLFPFPSTADNRLFFVDERIMQDQSNFEELVMSKAVKQTCFNIDPCDIYSNPYCCKTSSSDLKATGASIFSEENEQQSDGKNAVLDNYITNTELTLFIVISIIFVIVLGALFISFGYKASSSQM